MRWLSSEDRARQEVWAATHLWVAATKHALQAEHGAKHSRNVASLSLVKTLRRTHNYPHLGMGRWRLRAYATLPKITEPQSH